MKKQSWFCYKIARLASFLVATFVFKRKVLRNEIKGKNGPFVVIANHEAALDFVNLIGVTTKPMRFVISNSFYNSLPLTKFFDKIGVIPKQQFQTTPGDMKQMKSVVDNGEILVIYPAGLMCEDGLSTPIPAATYKFLKWLNTDVYVAKTSGTYFSMPKWAKGLRRGRTYMDIYKLFSKNEVKSLEVSEIKEKTEKALAFDAYREQEEFKVKYKNASNIEGLQNVLYMCPNCKSEFSIKVKGTNTLYCENCGFAHTSDEFSFLHKCSDVGEEIRYVSDWSRLIYSDLKEKIKADTENVLSSETDIYMIDKKKHKFFKVGAGYITLNDRHFLIEGEINGEKQSLTVSIKNFASLPFSPGKHLEIQSGSNIYRCYLRDGKLVMKFINMVKIFYELNLATK